MFPVSAGAGGVGGVGVEEGAGRGCGRGDWSKGARRELGGEGLSVGLVA